VEPSELKIENKWAKYLAISLVLGAFVFPVASFLKNFLTALYFEPITLLLNGLFFKILSNSLIFTVTQAFLSALCSVFLALFLGFVLSKHWFQMSQTARAFFEGLGLFYFVLPGVLVASIVLEGTTELPAFAGRGYFAVVAAHVFMNTLFVASLLAKRSALYARQTHLLDVSTVFGAGLFWKMRIYWHAVWKEIVLTFFPLIFIWSASSFATVLMLSGSPSRSTPEVLLYHSMQQDPSPLRVGVVFLIQFFWGLLLYQLLLKRSSHSFFSTSRVEEKTSSFVKVRYFHALKVWGALLVFSLPILKMLPSAFDSLVNFKSLELVDRFFWPFANTLFVVFGTLVISSLFWWVLCQVGSKYRRLLLVFSGLTTTSYALLWSHAGFDRLSVAYPFLQLLFLALAISLCYLPLSAFWIEQRFSQISQSHFDAARVLGCSVSRLSNTIVFPQTKDLMKRLLILVALFSLGELAFSGYFVLDFQLLPVVAKNLALRYDFSGHQILLLCLMVFSFVPSILYFRRRV